MANPENRTLDALLEMEDGAAAITATEVNSGGIKDLGSATAKFVGDLLVHVEAIDIAGDDELYRLELQGSTDAAFASGIENLAVLELGANEELATDTDVDSTIGTYVVPFTNKVGGRIYQYCRLKVVNSGVSSSITYSAYLTKRGD
jgi:hypothetical protein